MLRGRFAVEIVAATEQNQAGLAEIPLRMFLAEPHPSRSAVHQEIEEPLEWGEDGHHQYDWIERLAPYHLDESGERRRCPAKEKGEHVEECLSCDLPRTFAALMLYSPLFFFFFFISCISRSTRRYLQSYPSLIGLCLGLLNYLPSQNHGHPRQGNDKPQRGIKEGPSVDPGIVAPLTIVHTIIAS